jgi:aryl-phospho-beta-D-glucosidase BglC (GH1 family)
MRSELSHNLPSLGTSANRILRTDTMQPMLLRGVNRSGLEYTEPSAAGFLAAAAFTEDEVRQIILDWRANIIRVPFNQDWALHGRAGFPAEAYLASLDQVISWASALNAYTILDLHWLDRDTAYGTTIDQNGNKTPNYVAPTPNADTIVLWKTLAERYRDEPAVLFDLFNEPHNRLPDDSLPTNVIGPDGEVVESDNSSVGPKQWVQWASRLVAEVHKIRGDGLILVGGVDWAFDLRDIRIEAWNIVYSTHIYSNRQVYDWPIALGGAGEVPVFVGEWGGTDTGEDLKFGRNLAAVLRQQQLCWTAWSWVDFPQLVQTPRTPDYRPTAFGELVRTELCTHGSEDVMPQAAVDSAG